MTDPTPEKAQGGPETGAAPQPPAPPGPPAGAAPQAGGPADGGAGAPSGAPHAPEQGHPRKRRRRRRGRKPAGAAAEASGEPAPRPAHKPHRGRRRGAGEPTQHHALTAIQSLSAMAQRLLQVEGIDFLSMPRFMDIEVRIPLEAQRDGAKAAGLVMERILRRVKEVRDHDRALSPGAVYSYYTESADDATRPRELREVFDGYSSTGRPIFTDFVTMAIERKDEGIDQLLAGEDIVITHVTLGRALRTAQLAEFGKSSPIYRILGQVDAGLFAVTTSATKAAFSFQLLRGTTLEGRPRLRIHPVGAADLQDLADPSVAQTLSRFQRRLDEDSLRLAGKLASGEELDEEEFVLPLLNELAKNLSGQARRKSRRTKHADQRSEEGRPTAKAYEDADAATDERLLWDDRENTAVVLGPRGRVHVFTRDGKHVTSLVMQGSSIHKRRQQGHWRAAEPDERGELRIALRRRAGRGEAEAEAEASAPVPPPPSPRPDLAAPAIAPLPPAPPPVPPPPPTAEAPADSESRSAERSAAEAAGSGAGGEESASGGAEAPAPAAAEPRESAADEPRS